jgi:ribonuclease HIII
MPQPAERAAAVAETVAQLRAALAAAGLQPGGERPIDYGSQFGVERDGARVVVNVYGGKAGVRVVVGGAAGSPLHEAVRAIVERTAGAPATHQPRTKTAVMPRLTLVAAAAGHANGTAGVFGPGPWIGSDESGKGVYFGPLVAAAVYVAPDEELTLRAADVRDSKTLDDAAARRAAVAVRRLCAGRFAEELLAPAEYNRRYAEFKAAGRNLNHLLAELHACVLDAVLTRVALPLSATLTVIADQFADERLVRERLRAALAVRGQPLPKLLQTPRAEANIAVAAASILARDRFLAWLDDASARGGVRLPKGGANPAIVAAGRRIVQQRGHDGLGEVAKLHFATTARILG